MSTSLDRSFRVDPAELPGQAVIFGGTPAMREIQSRIDSVLSVDLPVLIQGESGTGRELIARFLHARSSRRDAPFVKLNCSAIPANLLESELFGAEKGFIKGASEDRPGLIEIADGGTLFLNEIGDLSLDLQGKLFRLLRDRSYTRIGGREERFGHIRVVCATTVDLQKAVELGSFREDLFYRINIVSLRPLPLRDRKSDIPHLCEYFLQKLSLQFRRNMPQLRPVTLQLLKQWDWPGNLRELENWIAGRGTDAPARNVQGISQPATSVGLLERGHRSGDFRGNQRVDSEGSSGESLEPAKNSRRTEYELSSVALQVARCGDSPKTQKPQGAATCALIFVRQGI
jgi:transcriptional regulator with PAS, ATPase and Fis domain